MTTVSTYAYVNPVVAVLAGIVILGEPLTWREGVGAALVVGSVVIILHRSRSAEPPADATEHAMPEGQPAQTPPAPGPPAAGPPAAGSQASAFPAAVSSDTATPKMPAAT